MSSKALINFDDIDTNLIAEATLYYTKKWTVKPDGELKFGGKIHQVVYAKLVGDEVKPNEPIIRMLVAEPMIAEKSVYLSLGEADLPIMTCIHCPSIDMCHRNAVIPVNNYETGEKDYAVDIKRCTNNKLRKYVKSRLIYTIKSIQSDKEFMDYRNANKVVSTSLATKENRKEKFISFFAEERSDVSEKVLYHFVEHLDELHNLIDSQDTIREYFKLYFIDGMSVDTIAHIKRVSNSKVRKVLKRGLIAVNEIMLQYNDDLTKKITGRTLVKDLSLRDDVIDMLLKNNITRVGELAKLSMLEFMLLTGVSSTHYVEVMLLLTKNNIKNNLLECPDGIKEPVEESIEKPTDVSIESTDVAEEQSEIAEEELVEDIIDYKELYESVIKDNEILSDEVSALKNEIYILKNRIEYKDNSTDIQNLDNLFNGEVLFNIKEMLKYYKDIVKDTGIHKRRVDIIDAIDKQVNVNDIKSELKSRLEVILKDCDWDNSTITNLNALGFSVEIQGNGHKYVYVTGHPEYGWTFPSTTKNPYSIMNAIANLLQIIF